jgi:hypothetical protein
MDGRRWQDDPVPPPSTEADDLVTPPTPEQLDRDLSGILGRAALLRIYDHNGISSPARGRHYRARPSMLTDVTDPTVIAGIAASLRLRPDCEIMAWMTWPDLWFEFTDLHSAVLTRLGWLAPDWLRWDPHGDIQLSTPTSLKKQLQALGIPDVAL